jgi:hypothetical protein
MVNTNRNKWEKLKQSLKYHSAWIKRASFHSRETSLPVRLEKLGSCASSKPLRTGNARRTQNSSLGSQRLWKHLEARTKGVKQRERAWNNEPTKGRCVFSGRSAHSQAPESPRGLWADVMAEDSQPALADKGVVARWKTQRSSKHRGRFPPMTSQILTLYWPKRRVQDGTKMSSEASKKGCSGEQKHALKQESQGTRSSPPPAPGASSPSLHSVPVLVPFKYCRPKVAWPTHTPPRRQELSLLKTRCRLPEHLPIPASNPKLLGSCG